MSTTITYKGNTLTTVENETKKLRTAGTWLEDDITVTDVSSSGGAAVIVDTQDPAGGTIREITTVEEYYIQPSKTVTPTASQQTVTPDAGYDALGSVIVEAGGGGGSSSTADSGVTFIDYDGMVIQKYSATEAMALTALPANPTHAGLTSQGWNWSLAGIKSYLTNHPEAMVIVGQMYVTDDGKTRLYCHFEEGRLAPYLSMTIQGNVYIDWGDGSAVDTLSSGNASASLQCIQHIYSSPGDYVITLDTSSATSAKFLGASNSSRILRNSTSDGFGIHSAYLNAIQKVELGNNLKIDNYAFNYCYSLTSITIPEGVTSIATYPFYNCYSLTSITIPEGVTSIGTYAFQYCYSLTSIAIPEGATNIATYAFNYCYSLTSITIPEGVTNIGSYAFNNCRSVANITIPDGVSRIDMYVFANCYSLTSITIPEGVTYIGSYAFNNCYCLPSITIPEGVTTIGINAFNGCFSLTSIAIPEGVTSIANSVLTGCYSLASVTIPDSVTSIAAYAFANCYSLANITIPEGVTSIGSYAIQNCRSLVSIAMPEGITSVADCAIQYCYSLTSITIPEGVTSIGANAFSGCYGMAEYHFLAETPPTLANTNAFTNIQSDCVIYVPYSADHSILEAYKTAANWSTYARYMQEEAV